MIFLALGLIGFGVGDLVRWSPDDDVSRTRVAAATISGAALVGLVGALSGMGTRYALGAGTVALVVLACWLGYGLIDSKRARPEYALGLMIGFGAALFSLATGNRIVRFTLAATESPIEDGEEALKGGRLLGPMERLLVGGSIIAGGLAGAGFVVAAKGLLRFRELTRSGAGHVDSITEDFLIGTFTSILLASICALFVLAAA